jgi:hypothetical protein
LALAVIIIIIIAHWPDKGDNSGPEKREHKYVMGKNAMRIGWDASRGEHEMCIKFRHSLERVPQNGDVITFIEQSGDVFRSRVIDIPIHTNLNGVRSATIVVIPLIQEQVRA